MITFLKIFGGVCVFAGLLYLSLWLIVERLAVLDDVEDLDG